MKKKTTKTPANNKTEKNTIRDKEEEIERPISDWGKTKVQRKHQVLNTESKKLYEAMKYKKKLWIYFWTSRTTL